MLYLIYGDDRTRVIKALQRIVKNTLSDVDEMNYVKFDGTQTLIQDIVQEANYLPLGYDKKIIAIDGAYFLQKEKGKVKIDSDQDFLSLRTYLTNPAYEIDLVFMVNGKDLNEKSDIYSILKEKAQVIAIKDPSPEEWKDAVEKYVTEKLGVKIDRDALEELIVRTGGDMALFQNSAKKLALYTDHIKYDDVTLMVTRPLEENAFQIFNFLINRNNGAAIKLYRDLKTANVEPVSLISLLAGQFRLLSEVTYLSKLRLSNDDIAKELNIKPIRVQILRKYTFMVSENAISNALEELFQLDLQIKSGQIDRYYGFELFLIKFNID